MENVSGRFRIGVIFKANLSLSDGFEVGFVERPIELFDMLAHVFKAVLAQAQAATTPLRTQLHSCPTPMRTPGPAAAKGACLCSTSTITR